MTFAQWRRFNFFDKETLQDPVFERLQNLTITASTSGRGQLIFGDSDGCLHFLDRLLHLNSFRGYAVCVTHLYQVKQQSILVTVGQDEDGVNPLIKVWNLDKIDKSGNTVCSRIVRAMPGNKPTPVTTLVVNENLNYMAAGFQDGSVVLWRGDVTRDRHGKSRTIHEAEGGITGLAFKNIGRNTVLFVSTSSEIVSINVSLKDKDQKEVLDFHGCDLGCAVISDYTQENQFVIGRQDAVYFYQPDGRGPCFAFEGEKIKLYWFRGYLVIVGKESKVMARASAVGSHTTEKNIVTVYDIQNKFIAFSSPIPEVIDVICEWGCLYILTGERKMFILQEKDTQTKLDILFRKNLYQQAIDLAKVQQYDEEGLIDIFRQYGDHLYSKGDHDGAIQQYIKTIGRLEASYVIRKFLDAQRIHNLTAYLQSLHKAQKATEDHTTLLLNCYTKLKDVQKLDEFIMTEDREVDFDVETAIKVCRQAGYYEHALFLAEKHGQHALYLKIQLEDRNEYQKGLEYIAKLEFKEAERNVKKYGKILVNKIPKQTTELLKKLCTDYKASNKPLIDQDTLEGSIPRIDRANAEEFIHIFVNNPGKLTEFLEHMIRVQPGLSMQLSNTLIQLYLNDLAHLKQDSSKSGAAQVEKERKILDILQSDNIEYDIDQALVMCQMNNFKAGILYLYEKAHLYQQIQRYHMDCDSYVHIIDTCKRFGDGDPNLWIQALAYFARKEKSCKPQIIEVLSHVDKHNLLPLLLVLQTLAHNSTTSLGVVKDFITKRLQQENDLIAEDDRLIKQYREETERMKNQIEELKSKATIFQVSKCAICSHPLELPSVHFLCHHSYHQHCFESYAENENECPACMPENRKLMDIIRAQEHARDSHEQFHHQLERTQDTFSVVADYYGRGLFNKVTLLTDPNR